MEIILEKLKRFESTLDIENIKKEIPEAEILGYGEISTVFALGDDYAYKRLPIFKSKEDADKYGELYKKYNSSLQELEIFVPENNYYTIKGRNGIYVSYLSQSKLNPNSICHKIVSKANVDQANLIIKLILNNMILLWTHNSNNPYYLLGLDAQISNWAIKDYIDNDSITENSELIFIDTSTPFIRENGKEQLNAELLLLSAPKLLRPLLKKFFLQDILDRYYTFRLVAIDIIANLYKEQRADIIEDCLSFLNSYILENVKFSQIEEITLKEIKSYYEEDKFIWKLFLSVRRLDRWIKTKIFRENYEFILPGNIKR